MPFFLGRKTNCFSKQNILFSKNGRFFGRPIAKKSFFLLILIVDADADADVDADADADVAVRSSFSGGKRPFKVSDHGFLGRPIAKKSFFFVCSFVHLFVCFVFTLAFMEIFICLIDHKSKSNITLKRFLAIECFHFLLALFVFH